jgi:triacylglycerol esterase/lipase EstA (alpha/beta hydrolase family)
MSILRWWPGLSPRRRLLTIVVAAFVLIGGSAAGAWAALSGPELTMPVPGKPGAVLLVPGYGGSTGSLDALAVRIRHSGRAAIVVHLAGDGTGDLRAQSSVLEGYVNQAVAAGSGPVTIIGYSAGGVVAWLWDVRYDGAVRAARIITLGSPLHGARLAGVGSAFLPGQCPVACQQLVPGSSLLTALALSPPGDRPAWLSLWTIDDQVVQPPASARLAGAVNVPLQSVCPGAVIQHSQLPTAPLVTGIVLRVLATGNLPSLSPHECASLTALGAG